MGEPYSSRTIAAIMGKPSLAARYLAEMEHSAAVELSAGLAVDKQAAILCWMKQHAAADLFQVAIQQHNRLGWALQTVEAAVEGPI